MAHGAIRMDKADILELTVSHLKALQEECASGKYFELLSLLRYFSFINRLFIDRQSANDSLTSITVVLYS